MPINMSPCGSSLEQQLSSIMEVLSKAAVSEISQLFSEGSASLRLQVSQSLKENEALRMTMKGMRSELFSLRLQTRSNAASTENGLQPLNNLKAVGGPPPQPPPPDCEHSSVKTPAEENPDIILIKDDEDMGVRSPAENGVGSGDRSTPRSAAAESPRADAAVSSRPELRILSLQGRGQGPLAARGLHAPSTAPRALGRPAHHGLRSSNSRPGERLPALDGQGGAAPQARDPETEPVPSGARAPLQTTLGGGPKSLVSRKEQVWRKKQTGRQARHKKSVPRAVCDVCGKSFLNSTLRSIHTCTHSGEKPYACVQCEKRFTKKDTLKIHLRTHTGERPYACVQCEKRFTRKAILKIHLRTHSGEMPWTCVQCEKRFTKMDSLKIHLRTHSGEKPCVCLHCEARFTHPNSLRRHMKACGQRKALTQSAEKL